MTRWPRPTRTASIPLLVPLAADYWYDSLVNVEADAPDSGAHAVTTFSTQAPNKSYKTKVDVLPSQ